MIRVSVLTIATSCILLTGSAASAQQSRPSQQNQRQQRPTKITRVDPTKQHPKVDKRSSRDARKFRQLEVSGDTVEANVKKVVDRLRWHGSLSSALQAARQKNKPLLWIQALGDLDGFL